MVALASGLGNCCFMLPAIKGLHDAGISITLYVETDFPMLSLWQRCRYADKVIQGPSNVNGIPMLAGHWRPRSWLRRPVAQYRLSEPVYRMSEWQNNLQLLASFNLPVPASVDVSDWCRDVNRAAAWDVGIIPGSKGGTWVRKRYRRMAEVAKLCAQKGWKVAVFGMDKDGANEIPGKHIKTEIRSLPDALAACRVVIGTDSGPTHLASSLGVPVVVIYTATSEVKGDPVGLAKRKIIRPHLPCHPCQARSRWYACTHWLCQGIEPVTVIKAAAELLKA
jgi:ADP-heptose:LPS heptosyltransferase